MSPHCSCLAVFNSANRMETLAANDVQNIKMYNLYNLTLYRLPVVEDFDQKDMSVVTLSRALSEMQH